MTPAEWKRRFVQRVMDRLACPREFAEETFEGGDYTPEEMETSSPEDLVDEEMSEWVNDEADDV